jgi:hypothetical protein
VGVVHFARLPEAPACAPVRQLSAGGDTSMTYRLSYDDGLPVSVKKWRNEDIPRTELFATEQEALKRARQLVGDGDHRTVVLHDNSGNTLGGIRLLLKLGMFAE